MADSTATGSGQPPAPPHNPEATPALPPVVVKKYANRRLYNTETSSYITLDNLAGMVRAGRDFVVYDAKSGEDITRGVLTQIIVEEESKGSAMLPTAFLRQLIGFYGGNLQGVVPRYLEYSMSSFARQQQQVRTMMERTFSPFIPTGVEEMSRQNMALFERAFGMWNPFLRTDEAAAEAHTEAQTEARAEPVPDQSHEVQRLQHEVESLQRQLAAAHAAALTPHTFKAEPAEAPANAPANVLRDPETRTPGKSSRRAVRGPTATN